MIGWAVDDDPGNDVLAAGNQACPFLPAVGTALGPWVTRRHGEAKRAEFYVDALRYSQWLWLRGKPAQAILQINKSWMADLEDNAVLDEFPPPYRALVWIMKRAAGGEAGFMGNPVRHFQHLASRMSGPRAEVRAWRAWLCFHLAEHALGAGFPRDGVQLAREGLSVPGLERARNEVALRGWRGEAAQADAALELVEGR